MHNVISTAFVIYTIYGFITVTLIMCAQKRDRFASIMIAITFPLLVICAPIASIFSSRSATMTPCPAGMEEAEAIVEKKRQSMFDSTPIEPRIASSWKRMYAINIELQAQRIRKFSNQLKDWVAA